MARVVGQGCLGQGRGVALLAGQASRGKQRFFPVVGVPGAALGLPEGDEQPESLGVVRASAGGVQELQGGAVVGGGLVVGQLGEGPVAGPGGVVDGPGRLGGRRRGPCPVVGEGGQVIVQGGAVDGLDGLGHPAVQDHPPARREPLIQGVPHQGMGEPVAGGGQRCLHDEAGLRRLLHCRDQVIFVHAVCLLEDWQLELQPDDGRDP
jgi:hypothetical protein